MREARSGQGAQVIGLDLGWNLLRHGLPGIRGHSMILTGVVVTAAFSRRLPGQFRNYCGLIKIAVWFSLGENHGKAYRFGLRQLRTALPR